jgi:hypothetical protein
MFIGVRFLPCHNLTYQPSFISFILTGTIMQQQIEDITQTEVKKGWILQVTGA